MEKKEEKTGGEERGLISRFKLFFTFRSKKKDENPKEPKEKKKGMFKRFFGREFFKNKLILWMISLNFLFNLANWLSLLIFINPVDSDIILHYNVYFGVDLSGKWMLTYISPAVGLLIFLLNLILAFYFFLKKERIASHVLLLSGVMVQLSLLIASTSVILINY